MSTYLRSLPATDERRRQQCQPKNTHKSAIDRKSKHQQHHSTAARASRKNWFFFFFPFLRFLRQSLPLPGKREMCVPPPTTHRDHLRSSRFLGKSARIEERTGFFRTPSSSRKLASTKNERDVLFLLSIFATNPEKFRMLLRQ